MTLDLRTCRFRPFAKPNNTPLYVDTKSNHPPSIIKNITEAINRRLSSISSDNQSFNAAIQPYQEALKTCGFVFQLTCKPEQPSRSRYVEFSETDKQELITEQRKKNTVQSTNCAANQFNKWMRTMRPSETRPISEIPPDVLDCYLGSFYAGVRQKDGSEYEPDFLTTYQRGIDRFLGENGYKFSISRDKEFSNSQATLGAKRAQLKTQGKANKPNAAKELTEREEELFFEKGVIGTQNPEALLFLVWLNNQKHFGFRGCQESRQMLWEDIALKHTADNTEFLEFNERENKTRSSGKVNKQPRAYPPKAFAIPDDPSRCPVYAYK
ncbi:uncharacterized protein KIAA1958-like [Ptychodera flava]|uniref:uncharacterized protein KIAA1958-like n=1 Tax=Ptychodera flava TaxID=63121 RepID=UPI00396A6475